MPASEAQIKANQRNAALSTGPKTPEGKEKARRNALKHGLTGAGVVLPEADAAEVERRSAAFAEEANASGEIGLALARHAALNSVRMERAADQQTAALSERVRQVGAEFKVPEGVDAEEAARLKTEAVRIAMFDPSEKAALARKYEASASRNFFRALKELRQLEPASKAATRVDANLETQTLMGSILKEQEAGRVFDARLNAMAAELGLPPMPTLSHSAVSSYLSQFDAEIDLPITVGQRR